ncbi:SHOCT domain-containing protein [Salibacterium aidingense]|uniref:SHOCT domain-containing protein n=1 Tax=Salibacterium aidingense TaxID=384933 RepID=UPI0004242767|nr:SHOCT domain-containing protein [Salibacterium aidingense]
MMNGMMNGTGMDGGFFGFGFFGILIILAIIAIIVWMVKGSDGNSPQSSSNRSLEILKERLAKGEISEGEYDRLKRKLE